MQVPPIPQLLPEIVGIVNEYYVSYGDIIDRENHRHFCQSALRLLQMNYVCNPHCLVLIILYFQRVCERYKHLVGNSADVRALAVTSAVHVMLTEAGTSCTLFNFASDVGFRVTYIAYRHYIDQIEQRVLKEYSFLRPIVSLYETAPRMTWRKNCLDSLANLLADSHERVPEAVLWWLGLGDCRLDTESIIKHPQLMRAVWNLNFRISRFKGIGERLHWCMQNIPSERPTRMWKRVWENLRKIANLCSS